MQRAKAGSMRLAAFLEMGIDNAYTLEASMAGDAEDHFTAQDLYDFGEQLGRR